MAQQNYANHARFVKGFHMVLGPVLLIGTIASFVNIWLQYSEHFDVLPPILTSVLFIGSILLMWFSRRFALTAQDRAIRAEETIRYFMLAHKPLDGRLTMAQIISLRFAPDEEFITLVDRAVNEPLSPDEIKREIKTWKVDNHRA